MIHTDLTPSPGPSAPLRSPLLRPAWGFGPGPCLPCKFPSSPHPSPPYTPLPPAPLSYGFDEVNLNCGCPSVETGGAAYGAALMLRPAHARTLVEVRPARRFQQPPPPPLDIPFPSVARPALLTCTEQ